MNLNIPEERVMAMVRRFLNIGNHMVLVHVTDTNDPPVVTGEGGGFFTNGGTPIAHPGAYSRKGWSNMHYQCETRTVYVGENWINRHVASLLGGNQ